ncbi:MAG: hypothetical protein HOP09_08130 [Hyphomicrobium sp.]|nr:hypothetical protein [Hyphomicrobium sp.]
MRLLAVILSISGTGRLTAQTLQLGQNLPTGSISPLQEPVQPRVALPPAEHMLGLILTTIIAIDQANKTGNYTVLRDLSAPDFSKANDASRLGLIFQVLREKGIDFSPLLQIPPEVSETPAIDGQGLLHLVGFFPTEPLRVNFELAFQAVEGRWRPYTISVYLAQIEAQQLAPVLTHKAAVTSAPAVAPQARPPAAKSR